MGLLVVSKECSTCKKVKLLTQFHKQIGRKYDVHSYCKECEKKYNYMRNQRIKEKKKDTEFKRKFNKIIRRCIKNRLERDPIFKDQMRLRKILSSGLQCRGFKKLGNFINLVGLDPLKLKEYLLKNAIIKYPNINPNYFLDGQRFHIDHIVPCSKFKLDCSMHQKLCFNYTNLQILTKEENLFKSDKDITI